MNSVPVGKCDHTETWSTRTLGEVLITCSRVWMTEEFCHDDNDDDDNNDDAIMNIFLTFADFSVFQATVFVPYMVNGAGAVPAEGNSPPSYNNIAFTPTTEA